ncbi:upstream stimulatory factor 1-like isoform X2 [Choristoneura fumiferana]|uniref:upstream stimulatory factor 1-like isoform X2 n=1 Tax=Choristoneura fumiferana TaxID=7141 RepID=UPI003D15E0A8
MAKVEIDDDIHDNSLENSGDGELMGMVDEGTFGSAEERSQLVSHSLFGPNLDANATTYNFRELSGAVTYKLVHMTSEESSNNMSSHSPTHDGEFYVISNPAEVFGTATTQKKATRKDPMQTKSVTAKKRDDKRRATHNEVERRRRDKINTWITKLAALVPNSGLPDTASKGGILAKACDHITELTEKQKRLEKLEVDNEKLVLEILRLNQELTELRKENSTIRNQLADNCVVVSPRPKGQKS